MPTKSISECKHDVHAEAEAKAHINQVPATPSPHNLCTGRSYNNRATFDSHWLDAGVRTCTEEQKGSEASARHRQQTENTTSVTSHQQLQSGEDQRPWRVLCWALSPHLSPLKLSTWAPCGTVCVVWWNVQWPASDSPLKQFAICFVRLQLIFLVVNKCA